MNADSAFIIGRTHTVCQDYCTCGTQGNSYYVLLADGCSSSPDTDIGARLLVKSAQVWLSRQIILPVVEQRWMELYEESVTSAAGVAPRLGLEPSCLDATLLIAYSNNNKFWVACYGDGVIVLGRKDGTLEVHSVAFPSGYPDYASYLLDRSRAKECRTMNPNGKEITTRRLPEQGKDESPSVSSKKGCEIWTGNRADYRFVALLSDGIHSFAELSQTETSKTSVPVPFIQVLTELLDFKSANGEFVQRRIQAFAKTCVAEGWQHYDDVSLAVLWLDTVM